MQQRDGVTLKTRTELRRLADLKVLSTDKNARHMKGEQFNQLVKNLKEDGVLTSSPLIDGETGEVLSGNHRVMAAKQAGIEESECIVVEGELHADGTVTPLTESRRVALQLSHNAIVGEDDPSVLRVLYDSLDLGDKLYSGLDEASFADLPTLDLESLAGAAPKYQEMTFTFLPEVAEEFQDLVARLSKKTAPAAYLARMDEFDAFFDAIVRTKLTADVRNTAMAVFTMVKLANERLDQIEAEVEPAP